MKKNPVIRKKPLAGPGVGARKTPKIDTQSLLHDLRVRQVQLEMQNEELRTVQEDLEAAIEKYSNYYDFAPVAYFTLDKAGLITETNLRGAAVVDLPRLQLTGTPFSRCVLPAQRHLFQQMFKSALTSGIKQQGEFRLFRNNLPATLVLAEAISVPEAANQPRRIRLTLTDITRQKENENGLKQQAESSILHERERLKGILDAMGDGVCIVGQSGDIEYVNQVTEREFGPVGNRKSEVYFHEAGDTGLWADREKVIAGNSATWEWHSAKNNRTYEIFATPIKNANGTVSKLMFFHDITDKRAIALALKNARDYLDATGVIMVSLDAAGKVTLINEKGREILGMAQEAVLGMDWFDAFIPEKDRGRARDHFNRLMAGKIAPPAKLESTILIKTGGERHYRWNHSLIKEEAGAILGVLAAGTDVTEQKNRDNALKQNDDKYRTIVETTQEGIWVYGTDYRITYVNEQMAMMMGSPMESLLDQSMLDFLPESERTYVLERKDDRRRQGIREKRINRKDGTFFWVLESASPLYSAAGDHIGTLGMMTDITQRKKAEESLKTVHMEMIRTVAAQSAEISHRQKALEEIYRIATEPQPGFTALCDQMLGSLSRLLSLPCMSLHIRSQEDLRPVSRTVDGAPAREMCPSAGCSLCAKVADMGRILNIKGPLLEDHPGCFCAAQGPFRSFFGIPIRDKSDELIGVVCGLDVKEREFTDDEIHLTEIFSRYLVHELERISLEKQLYQSQQLKLLGQLTSGVAHEVRNPLNAITAVTESLFQDIGDKPEYKTHMAHIRSQVERLSNLMVDLLELGRPINKSKLNNVSVASIMSGVMNSWQHSPLKDKCRILLLQPSLAKKWTMNADSGKLQQVFLNLLQNAAQHSPEKSEITVDIRPPKNGKIIIKISDQGPGIPPQNMEHMFEPFFTTRKGGIGLGMSIVKHILEMHGGGISLENNTPLPGLTAKVVLSFAGNGKTEGNRP